jgi:hypothetical protein
MICNPSPVFLHFKGLSLVNARVSPFYEGSDPFNGYDPNAFEGVAPLLRDATQGNDPEIRSVRNSK